MNTMERIFKPRRGLSPSTRTGSNQELWAAFIAIVVITFLYLFIVIRFNGVPGASGFFGHSIGILGFLLMLMTETLYSYRKRSRSARWGKMASWLQFHIFTGIVGPYMVLLHSSWKFNGIAGIVLLLTIVVALSGFIGRYIYTAVPRNLDGVIVESEMLEQAIRRIRLELQTWREKQPATEQRFIPPLPEPGTKSTSVLDLLFSQRVREWWFQIREWQFISRLDSGQKAQLAQVRKLIQQQKTLERQIASLAMARRAMALWHAVHVPIGLLLFFSAAVHVIGAIYFASLLR